MRRRANRAKPFCAVAILLIVACSASSRGSRQPVPDSRQHAAPVEQSLIQPGDRDDGLPTEAFELLTKSTTDSCSVCARDFRKQAFRILEERFRPGVVVRNDSLNWFARAPGSENELIVASQFRGDPKLTFRFHTAEDHLVGISESNMTDESLADRCRSAPAGSIFQGAIEIVPFAYGDGPTFLYRASNNSIQVHCKVLDIAGD